MSNDPVITVKDPLTVLVSNAQDVRKEEDENGEIVSLEIPDVPTVKLGNKLIIGRFKQTFRVNKIVLKEGIVPPVYELKIALRTKASLFILPMLPGAKYRYYYDDLLLNAFIATPEHEDVVALLYRWSGIKGFSEMEKAFTQLNIFVKHYDPDKKTTLYVFKVPEKHISDFIKFKEGKYSEISETYKRRILSFHNVDRENVLGKILYKDKSRMMELKEKFWSSDDRRMNKVVDLMDAELYSIPNLTTETFDPHVYRL